MGDLACEQEPPDFLETFLFFLSASHKIDFPNFHLGNKPNPQTKSLRDFWFLIPPVVFLFLFFCDKMVLEFNSTFCVFRGRERFQNWQMGKRRAPILFGGGLPIPSFGASGVVGGTSL